MWALSWTRQAREELVHKWDTDYPQTVLFWLSKVREIWLDFGIRSGRASIGMRRTLREKKNLRSV